MEESRVRLKKGRGAGKRERRKTLHERTKTI
jgi:hypothetical protein